MGFFDQPIDKRKVPPQVGQLSNYQPMPEQTLAQMSSAPVAPDGVDELPMANLPTPPLPQDYQRQQDALFNPGPLQRRYTDAAINGPGEAPHGVKGHLLGALQGFAQGGVPGAVLGGVAPGIPQRAGFLQQTLPVLAQQADQEMQQQAQQRQGYHALAQSTGFDPITHAPTLPMLQAQAMNQYRLGGLDARNRGLDIQEHRANAGDEKFAWQKQYQTQRLAQHQQGLDNGSHQLVKGMRADGKPGWFSVNKGDPSDVVQIADANGQPLGTLDEMLEGGRNARFAQGQAGAMARTQVAQGGAMARTQAQIGAAAQRQQTDIKAGKYKGKKRSTLFGDIEEEPAQTTAPSAKSVPRASVEAYAKKRGISYEQAERQAKAEGYQVSQ